MSRSLLEPVRRFWRYCCAGMQHCLAWRDAETWREPAPLAIAGIEDFTRKAAELRERAAQRAITHVSRLAGGPAGGVSLRVRLAGDNAIAIRLARHALPEPSCSSEPGGESRRDVILFERERVSQPPLESGAVRVPFSDFSL